MKEFAELRAGDVFYYTGTLYTARDAAHARLKALADAGEPLPADFRGAVLYYAGPAPAPPGKVTGSIGPTTSSRMDAYIDYMPRFGVRAMIGKGPRSAAVREACRRFGMVYFVAAGGAGALLAGRVRSSETVAFGDLGCEAVRRLEVENFPLIVAYDTAGGDVFAGEGRSVS